MALRLFLFFGLSENRRSAIRQIPENLRLWDFTFLRINKICGLRLLVIHSYLKANDVEVFSCVEAICFNTLVSHRPGLFLGNFFCSTLLLIPKSG